MLTFLKIESVCDVIEPLFTILDVYKNKKVKVIMSLQLTVLKLRCVLKLLPSLVLEPSGNRVLELVLGSISRPKQPRIIAKKKL